MLSAALEGFSRGDITVSTSRHNWMANNAMADSISMKMIDRNLLPLPVAPNFFSDKVGLPFKYTFMILNTIKPVTVAFTVKDRARHVHNRLVGNEWFGAVEEFLKNCHWLGNMEINIQIAEGNKWEIEISHSKEIGRLTKECDCKDWRNDHDTDIAIPHNPAPVYLWRFG